MGRIGLLVSLVSWLLAAPSAADRGEGDTTAMGEDEIARETSNPLGSLWMLKSSFDTTRQDGDATSGGRWSHSWTFQPTIPTPLPGRWMLVNRITFPTVLAAEVPKGPGRGGTAGPGAPIFPPDERPPGLPGRPPLNLRDRIRWDYESGFGDLGVFSLLGQNIEGVEALGQRGVFVWGVGPTFKFPTSSEDEFGSEKYSMGPAGVVGYIGQRYIGALLSQNWFSLGSRDGGGRRDDVQFSWLQVIYMWNLGGGWQLGGKPVVTADWEKDADDRWNVPIGLGVYRALRLGKLPVKIGLEAQYSPIHEDTMGKRWNFVLSIDPVIKPLIDWPWDD